MKLVIAAAIALSLASPALADQKKEAKKALDAGQPFQPSGYQVDGPTWYRIEGGKVTHIRDPRAIGPEFWREQERSSGGSSVESAPAE